MGWTNSTKVKNHLIDLDRHPTEYQDAQVTFDDNGDIQLPHRGIKSNSEKVKRLSYSAPSSQSGVTLNNEDWAQLNNTDLVPEQVVVAADDGLTQVYTLGIDYTIDWEDGKIRRIDGGSISDGADVLVYYQRYEIMVKDTDYTVDYSDGTIALKDTGDLEPETVVYVDYTLSAASGADDLITQAITEAEDKILSRLKDDYNGSSQDQGLITGATELTLSSVCRALAARALSDGAASAEGRSRAWRELASAYELSAWITLRPFLESPAIRPGNKKSNVSWEWI